jgi:alpha-beta hydrolase superfamily lysophospholipase
MEGSKVFNTDALIYGDGLPVPADVRTCFPEEARPVIVVCPGFLAYRRWGFFPHVSERLAEAGFHVVTISFSHSGTDDDTGMIVRPEEFASNRVSTEIADLKRVLSWTASGDFPLEKDPARGLLGHSRGGSVSILAAQGFLGGDASPRVESIATWSTPSRLDRYTDRRKKEWRKTGALVFSDDRSPVPLRLDYSYYEDIDSNRERYDVPRTAAGLGIPHLVLHGQRDAAVSISEARAFFDFPASGERRLEEIPGCGHTFGVMHPMSSPTAALEKAVSITVEWFASTLPGV